VARRANYGYEKRQKEINRQKKRAEKAERKRQRKESSEPGQPGDAAESGPGHSDSHSPAPAGQVPGSTTE
jgi:hypothetical protein